MTITAPPYSDMPLEALREELAAFNRLLASSGHWVKSSLEVVERAKAKCVAEIGRREARAA